MTQIEKAKELIGTFATGDTEKAASLLAEGYIQHNLADGLSARELLAGRPPATMIYGEWRTVKLPSTGM